MKRTIMTFVVVLAGLSSCRKEPAGVPAIRVAAAADLAFAFEEMARAFEAEHGTKVELILGSTGLLARQIAEGAPFDLFAAANVSFANSVVKAGACDGSTQALYGRGRIVLWTMASRPAGFAPKTVKDLAKPEFVKIAIANPEHAPYGQAAKEALITAGVWDAVSPRLVYGQNVQQTWQFAKTGNAEVAIVALSLAMVGKDGNYVLIDEREHEPIDQALVVCTGGKSTAAARKFALFVNAEKGRSIMRKYGFLLPGEAALSP